MLVYADTFGAAWNTALFFSDTCDKPTFPSGQGAAACNDDACGTSQSQVVGVLRSGYHYLIVSGANGESGDVTVHVDRAVVGTTNPIDLASGSGTLQGNVAGGGTTNLCEASGPQSNYWWLTCPDYAGGAFQASNCNTATWNTVLSLQIPRGPILSCDIDDFNCGLGSDQGHRATGRGDQCPHHRGFHAVRLRRLHDHLHATLSESRCNLTLAC
jgi:hypothetical protein